MLQSATIVPGRSPDPRPTVASLAREWEADMRTPLLRSLAQLAHEHSLAEARGISPAEVRGDRALGREPRPHISRREFLAGTAAAGVGLALTDATALVGSVAAA